MNIVDRIYKIIDFKGISVNEFSKKIDVSNGYFAKQRSANANVGSHIVEKIVRKNPEVDLTWLITGEGSMLRNDTLHSVPDKVTAHRAEKGIPLVDVKVIGDFGRRKFSIKAQDVKEYYVIPKFKDCKTDFLIEVAGESMYPKYASGDVVACTIIKENSFLQWGKVYVIGTIEQGLLVKRIYQGNANDSVECRSDNEKYPPFALPRNEITGLALVVGVIRLE